MPSVANNSREVGVLLQHLTTLSPTSVEAHELHKQIVNLLNPRMQGFRWGLIRSNGAILAPSNLGASLSVAFVDDNPERKERNFRDRLPHMVTHSCDYIQVLNPQLYIVRVLKDRTGCLEVGGEPWPNREMWRPLLEEVGPRKTAWEFLLEEYD